jgi:hypothetical protein
MIDAVAALGGRMLRLVFRGILLVRRPRPIHPHGVALTGEVRWLPGAAPAGIDWVDRPPTGNAQPAVARLSRSAGTPAPLPDVLGLAIRFLTPEGPADVELASTGFGFPSRFWLAPHRSPSKARLTTLLPYRGRAGPVLIAARTVAPLDLPSALDDVAARVVRTTWRLRLYHAQPRGRWHPFATLDLVSVAASGDTPLRFDASRQLLPGAAMYRWVRRLRDPSYDLVQG